jgi:hypothetical protein
MSQGNFYSASLQALAYLSDYAQSQQDREASVLARQVPWLEEALRKADTRLFTHTEQEYRQRLEGAQIDLNPLKLQLPGGVCFLENQDSGVCLVDKVPNQTGDLGARKFIVAFPGPLNLGVDEEGCLRTLTLDDGFAGLEIVWGTITIGEVTEERFRELRTITLDVEGGALLQPVQTLGSNEVTIFPCIMVAGDEEHGDFDKTHRDIINSREAEQKLLGALHKAYMHLVIIANTAD